YAACEIGIACLCAATPWLVAAVRALYVAAAHGVAPDRWFLTPLRIACAGLFLLPPTLLMGATLPLLVRATRAGAGSLGRAVASLYGANTLGGAAGAILSGYVLLPALGVSRTIAVAVAANLTAGLLGIRLARSASGPIADEGEGE